MDENDWNKLMADWTSELNQLKMKLEECNQKSKVLYNCLNLIMAFCNQLPELFRLATPEIKREIVQTCIRTLCKKTHGLISEPDNNIFNIFDTAECQAIFR